MLTGMTEEQTHAIHKPIMVTESMNALLTAEDGCYLDATFGDGGHTLAMLRGMGEAARVFASDRDAAAVARGKSLYAAEKRLEIRHLRFSQLAEEPAYRHGQMTGMMMDLGVSSRQLETPERGFSIRRAGPIDMRMDQSSGKPVGELLARMNARELSGILAEYGEEPRAGRIADAVLARAGARAAVRTGGLRTTRDLARVVESVMPSYRRQHKIHPATRVFAALRIFVNQELEELKKGLAAAARLLAPGGVLAVIGFHSLEHRIIKDFLRGHAEMVSLGKQKPSRAEVDANPRARGAILRLIGKREQ